MKSQSDKRKVVVRRLPPTISQLMVMEQIDSAFAGRYNWVSFRPGKSSQKHQSYARAYIDFKSPEDVIEFAELFNDHLFVNEKGTQFKAVVEYAPSQRVPKLSKNDGREGAIYKDTEYLDFLEFIAKPTENLPSAEIQLERREAERSGTAKEAPIVTPLMDFVRQKRAAKTESRRILSNGKISRRASTRGSPSSSLFKRGSEKKKISARMFCLRDSTKSAGRKEKSYILIPNRDDQVVSEKTVTLASSIGSETLKDESGVAGFSDAGKKKILLLKRKEKELLPISDIVSQQQNISPTDKPVTSSTALKQSQCREASGRIIRSILLNKDLYQHSATLSEQQIQTSNLEKDKRPPRPPNVPLILKDAHGAPNAKVVDNDLHASLSEKQEKHARNKDKPDRVIWAPLRRSDGSYASDESLSLSTSQSTQSGNCGDNSHSSRSAEVKSLGSGLSSHSSLDNRSHKHFGRRGPSYGARDVDGPSVEGKPSRRGGASGYVSHEKQVWVQKSSSDS